jgi:hypothetical protein
VIRRTDIVTPGFYETRLVKQGPPVAVRIAYAPPDDPITGEPLDRSYRVRCWIRGEEIEDAGRIHDMAMTARPIEEHRYRYLMAVAAWEVEHRPDLPAASPRQAVDLGRIKPLY